MILELHSYLGVFRRPDGLGEKSNWIAESSRYRPVIQKLRHIAELCFSETLHWKTPLKMSYGACHVDTKKTTGPRWPRLHCHGKYLFWERGVKQLIWNDNSYHFKLWLVPLVQKSASRMGEELCLGRNPCQPKAPVEAVEKAGGFELKDIQNITTILSLNNFLLILLPCWSPLIASTFTKPQIWNEKETTSNHGGQDSHHRKLHSCPASTDH